MPGLQLIGDDEQLRAAIREAQPETEAAQDEAQRNDDIDRHFDDIVAVLATLDVDRTWEAATELERRVLIDEFVEELSVLPGRFKDGAGKWHTVSSCDGHRADLESVQRIGGAVPVRSNLPWRA